jgi:pimeloyl-ACP methyl ester carboxylesterase
MSAVKPGRSGRRLAILAAAVSALVLVGVLAVAWYFSSVTHSGLLKPDYSPADLNLLVVDVEGDRIVLKELPDKDVGSLTDSELWGLEGESGYGHVGDVLEVNGAEVTRRFESVSGRMAPGDHARLDSFAFRGDPLSARGLAFQTVSVPSPLGEMPAWKLDGTTNTWVIFVHGWRSSREEALRILPTISALGLHSLVITYRNDQGAPASDDGLIWWGATEWQDLEAAVRYVRAQGAESVVLYGYSMGGGIVTRFLQESDNASVVVGAVLDAPMLDFEALVDFQAGRRHVPGVVGGIAKRLASWRFGVDWSDMDHTTNFARVQIPILLFHGDEDDRAPIQVSQRLAEQRPDIVTLVIGHGAGHVRTWNIGPEAYEARVRDFLASVARVPVR